MKCIYNGLLNLKGNNRYIKQKTRTETVRVFLFKTVCVYLLFNQHNFLALYF